MRYKIQGTLHNETIKVKVEANNEQEAIEKAKKKYRLSNPTITTTMMNKQLEQERLLDRAWNRKGSPYVKVDQKSRTVSIFV